MSFSSISYAFSFFLAFSILILAKLNSNYKWHKQYKLPPGPKGLPYFGHMFSIPPFHQGPWAKDLGDKYGEMFTLRIASNTWVFLNSSRVVTALLSNRSAIYSSRPPFPYTSTILSGGCRIVMQPYGPQWRTLRKVLHSILNIKNAPTFSPFQDLESKQLLYDVLKRPEDWFKANQRFASSVVMSVVFGKRVISSTDKDMEAIFQTSMEFILAQQIGANWVDTIYPLTKLPTFLQWWRKRGQEGYERVTGVYTRETEDLKRRMEKGACPPCFATKFLSDPETRNLGEAQTVHALGSLIEAGSDTSRMTITQIIAAAATDSRWVKAAQRELDSVCGSPTVSSSTSLRLPTFADRVDLPYISAVVKEGFRWRPFTEIGMPHMLIKDDEFEGYKFPANTVFTWNAWGIALNEDENKDALRFWPDRWLDSSIQGSEKEKVEDPLYGIWGFGAGRRACTGYHVGDTNVWIAIARLLYCFDFEEDPERKIDTLNMNVAEHRWAPFEVKIKIRSEAHKELVEREGGRVLGVRY